MCKYGKWRVKRRVQRRERERVWEGQREKGEERGGQKARGRECEVREGERGEGERRECEKESGRRERFWGERGKGESVRRRVEEGRDSEERGGKERVWEGERKKGEILRREGERRESVRRQTCLVQPYRGWHPTCVWLSRYPPPLPVCALCSSALLSTPQRDCWWENHSGTPQEGEPERGKVYGHQSKAYSMAYIITTFSCVPKGIIRATF